MTGVEEKDDTNQSETHEDNEDLQKFKHKTLHMVSEAVDTLMKKTVKLPIMLEKQIICQFWYTYFDD